MIFCLRCMHNVITILSTVTTKFINVADVYMSCSSRISQSGIAEFPQLISDVYCNSISFRTITSCELTALRRFGLAVFSLTGRLGTAISDMFDLSGVVSGVRGAPMEILARPNSSNIWNGLAFPEGVLDPMPEKYSV